MWSCLRQDRRRFVHAHMLWRIDFTRRINFSWINRAAHDPEVASSVTSEGYKAFSHILSLRYQPTTTTLSRRSALNHTYL
jgi:hypothetical protein